MQINEHIKKLNKYLWYWREAENIDTFSDRLQFGGAFRVGRMERLRFLQALQR